MANLYHTLSTIQLETMARIRSARKHGFILSLNDCDTLIAIALEMTCPAHTRQERPNPPCNACRWLDEAA
jgi:hypothetical protein